VSVCRYNVREETFVTETEAAATNYLDAVSGKPLKKMLESSYFFKQSRYGADTVF
jgi:methionyl-tRNA synthetase